MRTASHNVDLLSQDRPTSDHFLL